MVENRKIYILHLYSTPHTAWRRRNINTFFYSISADLPLFDFNCVAQLLSDIDVFLADLVTEPHSIENKLAYINVHKSPGPDQIRNWFLQDFAYLADCWPSLLYIQYIP